MTDPQKSPEPAPSPDATQRILPGTPQDPRSTVKMETLPPLVAGSDQTQRLPPPPLAAGSPAGRGGWLWTALGGAAALAVLGGGGYLLFLRKAEEPAAVPHIRPVEAVPPGVQTYLDQAKAGDAHAMRMLGVMYYYGLNVPQDREKGLYWYRQAAEKGSDAAREELAKLAGAAK